MHLPDLLDWRVNLNPPNTHAPACDAIPTGCDAYVSGVWPGTPYSAMSTSSWRSPFRVPKDFTESLLPSHQTGRPDFVAFLLCLSPPLFLYPSTTPIQSSIQVIRPALGTVLYEAASLVSGNSKMYWTGPNFASLQTTNKEAQTQDVDGKSPSRTSPMSTPQQH